MRFTAVIIFSLLASFATVHGAEFDLLSDTDDSLILEYAGGAAWLGFTDMVVDGDLVYATMRFGVKILDLSDPENPAQLSQVYLDGSLAYCLALKKPYLYVSTFDGLTVFDVTDPSEPVLVGQLDH